MPKVKVVLYQEENGECPLLERLADMGHELKRPEADYLRDHIYELRAKNEGINYRMLYFFNGREVVVVSHGIMKQRDDVPNSEIDLAIKRMRAFKKDPKVHTYEE